MRSSTDLPYASTTQRLRQLCRRLRCAPRIAIDTEFVSERRFSPDLCLIQVALEDECAAIDPRSVGDLSPLLDVITNPRIEKVLHAGRQDLQIIQRLTGKLPSPIFDTQIAAALVGFGEQVSYARLVKELVGVTLGKQEGFTDWTVRPLSPRQIEYALDDVRYLLPVADRLREELDRLGRSEWAREEFMRLEEEIGAGKITLAERYRRVRRSGTLSARGLAVLRELTSWREALAEKENRPRGRIIPDEVLVELARKAPTDLKALQSVRALSPGIARRYSREILNAIKEGLQVPESRLPAQPRSPSAQTPPPGLVDLLATVLRARAEEHKVAPGILAKRSDLERMCLAGAQAADRLRVLQGWRLEIVGRELLDVLEGRRAVGFDLAGQKVKTFPVENVGS